MIRRKAIVSGTIPKYRQLLQMLRNRILAGDLPPGAQLPTEQTLAQTYKVSRGTVRKAIAQLEAEKLVRSEQGVGTFVRAAHPSAIPFRFSRDDHVYTGIDGPITYDVLAQEVLPAPMEIAERLGIASGTPVIHVARLKRVGGEAVAYAERYLPETLCPSLLDEDLTAQRLHDLLVDNSDLPLLRAEIEVEAHVLGTDEAALLEREAGVAAVVINRMTYTAPNRPAVSFWGLFVDQCSLSVEINELATQSLGSREFVHG